MATMMFRTPLNERTVTLRLRHRDVTRILRACLACAEYGNEFLIIHDEIKEALDDFDRKYYLETEEVRG